MSYINEMNLKLKSLSENESFARTCVASFCLAVTNNMETINDIKTAVSEAVTNCVVHAYPNCVGEISINVRLFDSNIEITIFDYGVGIENIEKAKEPFYTTKPNSGRSGMGFTVMESFMDGMEILSKRGKGTTVILKKYVAENKQVVGG